MGILKLVTCGGTGRVGHRLDWFLIIWGFRGDQNVETQVLRWVAFTFYPAQTTDSAVQPVGGSGRRCRRRGLCAFYRSPAPGESLCYSKQLWILPVLPVVWGGRSTRCCT